MMPFIRQKIGDFYMNISDTYEIEEFIVLNENTHKYSSTKVESSGGAAGQQNISSTVTHHVSQDIWLRDPETQKETKFTCENYTLGVLPGHSLVFFKNHNTNNIERIVNINTGEISDANGEYNETSIKNTIGEKSKNDVIFSTIMMLPIFCPILFFITLRNLIFRTRVQTSIIWFISATYMCSAWLQVFREDFSSWFINESFFKVLFYGPGLHWWLVLPAFFGFYYGAYIGSSAETDDMTSHCHALDEFVSDYIRQHN
ncbi:hypothetical protein ACK34X_04190 [Aeromonas veronii]